MGWSAHFIWREQLLGRASDQNTYLRARVLILEHLIGARDNNVGGSDVSPCRWRGICCTSFCVRSPLRNLLLSVAKLWRATVRSIDRALLCCKRVGDTHSRHRRDQFNISASRHFSHSATALRGAPTCWSIKYRPLILEQLRAPGRCCPQPPRQ